MEFFLWGRGVIIFNAAKFERHSFRRSGDTARAKSRIYYASNSVLQSTYKQIGSCLNNMLTQSTIGDSGVGDSSGSVHESPTKSNQAQFNLIYPNQVLGIQALGIQALGI